MSRPFVCALAVASVVLSIVGCPPTSEPNACTPGQSASCGCIGGGVSSQVCRADGTGFEPCQCIGSPDGGMGSPDAAIGRVCGDGTCSAGETCANCPADCPCAERCGNGSCVASR